MGDCLYGFLLRLENQGEGDAYYQCKTSEDKPACGPVANQVTTFPMAICIHDLTCCQGSDGGTQTIGHHHEQALSRRFDTGFALLIDKDTARHIEEVESYTVDDARQYEEQHARHGRIANTKEAKAEHPGEERHEQKGIIRIHNASLI